MLPSQKTKVRPYGKHEEQGDLGDCRSRRGSGRRSWLVWLKHTLKGLQKLDCFLDALENLAVTS
ncbi:hypothetical protein FQN60_004188, partial [Etheostoma spectabile]